jgi:ATP-dependent RNA helicase DeaD
MNENQLIEGQSPTSQAAAENAPSGPSFADLGLRPEVLASVEQMGFADPMQVQSATIPLIFAGRDVLVQSRTGSGKTAAFGIPLVDRIVKPEDKFVQAIVLLPTRELALQVAGELARIATNSGISIVPVYGGAPMGRQIEQLKAGGQIVCGTPGRVLDHLRRGTLSLERVRCAVLDECDEMLSMGFQEDIEAILERTPPERQTLLFSATVPEGIQRLARRFLKDPELLKLSADFVGVHEIRHVYYAIPGGQRESELLRVINFESPSRAIVFCNTREETGRVAEFLRRHGLDAEAISSDLSQADRERVMGRMRAGGIRFLVATDVAARGIDLENLTHVFNYTFPESPEIYIHRTGRTGRAGRHGTAISLIGPTEVGSFYYVKLLYKIKPEERSLPSEAEIRSKREGERIEELRQLIPGEPGPDWRSLARRLMTAPDGERLCAALLEKVLTGEAAPSPREPMRERVKQVRHERTDRERSDRAPARDESARRRERPPGEGARRDDGRRGERSVAGEAPRTPERGRASVDSPDLEPSEGSRPPTMKPAGPSPSGFYATGPKLETRAPVAPSVQDGRKDGRREPEFWEVWKEEAPGRPSPEPAPSRELAGLAAEMPVPGQARLFLNLGRKDRATADEVSALFAEAGTPITTDQIEVMNTHSYINVPAETAERLCAAITGRDRQGRTLSCEPARPRRK